MLADDVAYVIGFPGFEVVGDRRQPKNEVRPKPDQALPGGLVRWRRWQPGLRVLVRIFGDDRSAFGG